jgi:hypothetical protein
VNVNTEQKVEDLERRLRLTEDRLAILEIEGAYAKAFDGRHGREWAALFTADGSYETRRHSPTGDTVDGPFRGPEALAQMCEDFVVDCIHLLNVPQLNFSGDQATGRVHFTVHTISRSEPRSLIANLVGYYDVEYRRTAEGWRIQRRVSRFFAEQRANGIEYDHEAVF